MSECVYVGPCFCVVPACELWVSMGVCVCFVLQLQSSNGSETYFQFVPMELLPLFTGEGPPKKAGYYKYF